MNKQTYGQFKEQVRAAQEGFSHQEIMAMLQKARDESNPDKSKFTDIFDPETAKPISHRWVDRGAVMSCEGAGHANHRAFKRR